MASLHVPEPPELVSDLWLGLGEEGDVEQASAGECARLVYTQQPARRD